MSTKIDQNTGFAVANFKLTGIAPLLLHNNQTANPMNEFTKKIKALTSLRKKSDADHEQIAKLEFHAGLYVDQEGKVVMPAKNVLACLLEGAAKLKLKSKMKPAVFVFQDSRVFFEDMNKTPDELWEQGKHVSRVPVKIGQATTMRCRPQFDQWEISVQIQFDHEQVNPEEIAQALRSAGLKCGLGDWKPQHGRFLVKEEEAA